MAIKKVQVLEFKYGLITSEEEQSIPRGASTDSLNFLTKGTKIELRRGYALLGVTENSGAGKITGIGVGKKPDGTDILFRTRKRKIEYLNTSTNDWVEVGTNTLPADVVSLDSLGEEISIEPYSNVTGPQIWFNSKLAGPWKIMTANPGSITSLFVSGTNYKGKMRIKTGRMYVWDRAGNPPNRTDVFASKLDVKNAASYTQISAEAVAGSGTVITGTLAFKAAGATRICFEVTFERDTSAETFTDNGDGTLTSSAGGTGTINYTTGAFSLTFIGSATAVTATYRWAGDTAGGIADFAFSATRVATEGFILKQSLGGDFQNLMALNGVEYCLHKRAAWAFSLSADDLSLTNVIFRSKMGVPNHRAAVETADGIYYIDDSDENDPHFRLLTLETNSNEALPRSISKQFKISDVKVGVNLSNYLFDKGACIEFGDFILFACRTKNSASNNRVFVYNKTNRAHDVVDYFVSCFAVYDGALVAGDSISDNVYTIFSGVDDDDSTISGHWSSSLDNLGYSGMKRTLEVTLDGEVGPEQGGKISMSLDRGQFVEIRSRSDIEDDLHAIEGNGDYVDTSQRVSVGPLTLGRGEVGGGGDGIEAYHYRRTFRIALDKFEYAKFKIEPTGLGYLSLSEFTFRDVRVKSAKTPARYNIGR